MSKNKKYHYTICKESTSCWSVSIIRHVSSSRTNVSKSQSDFATKAEAIKWAETELETFQQTQVQRNSRKNEQRKKNQEQRESRSSRRAAKTAAEKVKSIDTVSEKKSTDVWKEKSGDSQSENAQIVELGSASPNMKQNHE